MYSQKYYRPHRKLEARELLKFSKLSKPKYKEIEFEEYISNSIKKVLSRRTSDLIFKIKKHKNIPNANLALLSCHNFFLYFQKLMDKIDNNNNSPLDKSEKCKQLIEDVMVLVDAIMCKTLANFNEVSWIDWFTKPDVLNPNPVPHYLVLVYNFAIWMMVVFNCTNQGTCNTIVLFPDVNHIHYMMEVCIYFVYINSNMQIFHIFYIVCS